MGLGVGPGGLAAAAALAGVAGGFDGGAEGGKVVARKVAGHGRLHQAFLACGRAAAEGARAAVPEILVCNMDRRGGDVARYIRETIERGDAFIQLHRRHPLPTPEQIRQLRDAGVRINYFGTNRPDELEGLFELGIDFPLVDDLLPMMEGAAELGIAPHTPEF